MLTKARSWYRFLAPDRPYNHVDLMEDLARIRKFYRLRGYYQARVSRRVIISGDRVRVMIKIVEGRPVLVTRLDVMTYGFWGPLEAAKVKARLGLKLGRPLDLIAYRLAKQRIVRYLADHGFARGAVLGRILVSLKNHRAWVKVRISPGRRYRFGRVLVPEGRLQKSVLRRALTFKPGQTYSGKNLTKSRERLTNLRLFRSVSLRPAWDRAKGGRVPVVVDLKRAPANNVKIGVGYGTEDRFRTSLIYTRRDPLGLAGRFEVVGRYSYRESGFESRYVKPYIFDSKTHLTLHSRLRREREMSFIDDVLSFGLTIVRRPNDRLSWLFGVATAVHRPFEISVGDQGGVGRVGTSRHYRVSSASIGMVYDSTDNTFTPSRGGVVSLSVEMATGLLGSEVRFIRPRALVTRYITLWPKWVLAGKLALATITPTEGARDVYIFERLFLGGDKSVRGYNYQKLGPLDYLGQPLGGRTSIEAGIELRVPIYRRVNGVLFVAAGQVNPKDWNLSTSNLDPSIRAAAGDSLGFRYTCGVGLRYNTPIGPLRLDIGYKLNRPRALKDDYAIHFSIGQAF